MSRTILRTVPHPAIRTRRTGHCRLRTFCLALASAVSLATQQKPDQPPRPTFTASVDMVSVDVNVIDRNGRPVRDLGAADFTLSVDGRPRKIASAQFISVTAPETSASPAP